jgi:microcystin-dependent protein
MDPFIAEIRIVGFNFAPQGWAFCDGQILPLSQNTALFSLLGTTYGGNGLSTFALPDLQGRAPMQEGQGPGLSFRSLGEEGGSTLVSLLESEIPNHNHQIRTVNDPGLQSSPQGAFPSRANMYKTLPGSTSPMNASIMTPSGGSLPHNNMQPYLTLNYIIALQGIFPPRP